MYILDAKASIVCEKFNKYALDIKASIVYQVSIKTIDLVLYYSLLREAD